MRIRKTELQELTDLLSAPHDSVEDLVNVVWKRIDESRRVHEAYVILVNHGGGIILSYGVYDTRAAAEKDLTKFRSTTGAERATITKLLSSSQFFDFDNAEDYR